MIRLRFGTRWKVEVAAIPEDSVALELDGLGLFPGAAQEPLVEVALDAVAAVTRLWTGEARLAELLLPECHEALVLERDEEQVYLEVLSLGRPAHRRAGPLLRELSQLRTAVLRGVQQLLVDLDDAAPTLADDPSVRQLRDAWSTLDQSPLHEPLAQTGSPSAGVPDSQLRGARAQVAQQSLELTLTDPRGRLPTYRKDLPLALAPLCVEGTVTLTLPGQPPWSTTGLPVLTLLELCRDAQQLLRTVSLAEKSALFQPCGTDHRYTVEGSDLCDLTRLLFDGALVLCAVLSETHQPLIHNPWVHELWERANAGLSELRLLTAGPSSPAVAPAKSGTARQKMSQPLVEGATLRRVQLLPLWSHPAQEGCASRPALLLGPKGPLISSPELACGLSPQGAVRFRHVSSRGVAVNPKGDALVAEDQRILGFVQGRAGATWLHDHDGLPIGRELLSSGSVWLVESPQRALLAFDALCGRELWRIAPGKTQQVGLSLVGDLAFVSTDSGFLFALRLSDGDVLYRVRATLPFHGPAQPFGDGVVARLLGPDRCALLLADLQSGDVRWTTELPLLRSTVPLIVGRTLYIVGRREGAQHPTLAALNARGKVLFEVDVPLGESPWHLVAARGGVVVACGDGAGVYVTKSGQVAWRVGPAKDRPLAHPIAPTVARGLALLPGPTLRIVDVGTGEIVADRPLSPDIADVAVDSRQRVYLLNDDGALEVLRLEQHLAVMD